MDFSSGYHDTGDLETIEELQGKQIETEGKRFARK